MLADDEALSQFIAVTGVSDVEVAQSILESNNWNLEAAIAFFLDPPDTKSSKHPPLPKAYPDPYSEPEVRAPISAKREQLAVPDFPTLVMPKSSFQIRDKMSRELWKNSKQDSDDKKLSELFAPPFDILFEGNFEDLKKAALQQNKLAMINLQDVGEFSCQKLNRDVLRLPAFQSLVKDNFVFQQLHTDTPDGQRMLRYYELDARSVPIILFIDPLTVKVFTHKAVLDVLQRVHGSQQELDPKPDELVSNAVEEEQLQAAIALSMKSHPQSEDKYRRKDRGDPDSSPPKRPKLLKPRSGPCVIQGLRTLTPVRLPDGKTVKANFEEEETLQDVIDWVVGTENLNNVILSSAFPKKTYMDLSQTLKAAQLTPRAVVIAAVES